MGVVPKLCASQGSDTKQMHPGKFSETCLWMCGRMSGKLHGVPRCPGTGQLVPANSGKLPPPPGQKQGAAVVRGWEEVTPAPTPGPPIG